MVKGKVRIIMAADHEMTLERNLCYLGIEHQILGG